MSEDNRAAATRVPIIAAVANPLNFLTLAVLIVEVVVVLSLSPEGRAANLWYILCPIFVLVFIVCGLAVWRPEALHGVRPFERLHAQSLADDIYQSIDGYFGNLPEGERDEAWLLAIKTLRDTADKERSHVEWALIIANHLERRSGVSASAVSSGPVAGL